MEKSKSIIIAAVLLVAGLLVGGFTGYFITYSSFEANHSVSVFAAGSLEYALGNNFNHYYRNATGITPGSTFSGSISGARNVQGGTHYDVFISASAGVIPSMLMPNYTSWMVIFATNEMAVTWLNHKYSIPAGSFWFENITAKNVTVAASTSQLDPSGFQAIEMTKLAGLLYTGWYSATYGEYVQQAFGYNFSLYMKYNNAWNSWFGKGGTLEKEGWGGNFSNNDTMALYDQVFGFMLKNGFTKLTTVEIGMDGFLEAGTADYALTYKSQAVNQNLSYFRTSSGANGLSSWINLGNISKSHVSFYSMVNSTGPTTPADNIGNLPGAPILYAATVLNGTSSPSMATSYLYDLVTGYGQYVLSGSDFNPITTPYGYNIQDMPSSLQAVVQPIPQYIPASAYE